MGGEQSRPQNNSNISRQQSSRVQNYQPRNPDDPNPKYAVRVDRRPQLSEKAKVALSNRGLYSKIQNNTSDIFHILQKDAYYQGQWKKGLPDGYGNLYTREGYFYEGKFVEGQAQCQDALIIYPNGCIYDGQVSDSTLNGHGRLIYPNEELIYDGNFWGGKPEGYGQQAYKDGTTYKGSFRNGVKHGNGIYLFNNGNMKYQGQFHNGQMSGKGSLINYQSGGQFRGQFHKGMKNGYGTFDNSYGSYQGNFHEDQLNGPGKFTWKDGKIYEGDFKETKMHGKGRIYYPNGQVVQGFWENDHNVSLDAVHQGKYEKAYNQSRAQQSNYRPPNHEPNYFSSNDVSPIQQQKYNSNSHLHQQEHNFNQNQNNNILVTDSIVRNQEPVFIV